MAKNLTANFSSETEIHKIDTSNVMKGRPYFRCLFRAKAMTTPDIFRRALSNNDMAQFFGIM
jgi:hypothetical protein